MAFSNLEGFADCFRSLPTMPSDYVPLVFIVATIFSARDEWAVFCSLLPCYVILDRGIDVVAPRTKSSHLRTQQDSFAYGWVRLFGFARSGSITEWCPGISAVMNFLV